MDKKNVVVIGGGTGQSVILRGLKNLEDVHLTTIVTVADDGGSTGRLRKSFQVPAMGDIRNVMIALSESEPLLTMIMDYRFKGEADNEIVGHNLGNLILTALMQTSGSFMQAIADISKVLKIKGDIIPATTQMVTLCARMSDGTVVRGESNIPKYDDRIIEVFYREQVKATVTALDAILNADIIIFGIGSIYTSILPNIIIDDIRKALLETKATKIYLCNAMTQHGETDNYQLEDHVQAIEDHLNGSIDLVIYANDKIPSSILERYVLEKSYPVSIIKQQHDYLIEDYQLLNFGNNLIRHDSNRIKEIFADVIKRYGKK